jgi:hypothetical protein
MRTYYHIIEEGDYGRIATHGFKTKLSEAEKEVARLSDFFPELHFYVYPSISKHYPSIVNL